MTKYWESLQMPCHSTIAQSSEPKGNLFGVRLVIAAAGKAKAARGGRNVAIIVMQICTRRQRLPAFYLDAVWFCDD